MVIEKERIYEQKDTLGLPSGEEIGGKTGESVGD